MSHMQQTLSIQTHWLHFLGVGLFFTCAGLCMIYWAWLGKRQGDNPFCARCHYDLNGIDSQADTCPECGSDLLKHCAIVRGHRQTRKITMAVAVTLLLAGLTWMTTTGYHAYHRVNWYHYKPTSWLATDAMTEYNAKTKPNLQELSIRIDGNQLTDEQRKAIVPELLALHASTQIWRDESFKNLLHDLLAGDAFTQQQIEQLFKQNYSTTFQTRPVLRRQRSFRYDTNENFPELGSGWKDNSIRFVTTHVSRKLMLNEHIYSKSEIEKSSEYKSTNINSGYASTQQLHKPFLKEIADGPAHFEFTIKRTVQLVEPVKSEPFELQSTAGQDVKIVGKDEWVDTFEVQQNQIKPMDNAWVASRVIAKPRDTQVWFRIDSPPIALAMSVWLIDGDKREKMGNLLVDTLAADKWYRIKRYATMKLSDQVRVDLRPEQAASDTQMMLCTYWGRTMTRDDVPVNGLYKPAFNMDQSVATKLEETVTITRLKRENDNTLSFYITAKNPPLRIAYTPTGPWKLQTDQSMNVLSHDSHSYQSHVEFDPTLDHIFIDLKPNPDWERFGKLDILPTGLPMHFEKIPVPKADELIKEVWQGQVILPEETDDD